MSWYEQAKTVGVLAKDRDWYTVGQLKELQADLETAMADGSATVGALELLDEVRALIYAYGPRVAHKRTLAEAAAAAESATAVHDIDPKAVANELQGVLERTLRLLETRDRRFEAAVTVTRLMQATNNYLDAIRHVVERRVDES